MSGWFIYLSVQMFQPIIFATEGVNLSIIIEDIHQFISHCRIPLDSWVNILGYFHRPGTKNMVNVIIRSDIGYIIPW